MHPRRIIQRVLNRGNVRLQPFNLEWFTKLLAFDKHANVLLLCEKMGYKYVRMTRLDEDGDALFKEKDARQHLVSSHLSRFSVDR